MVRKIYSGSTNMITTAGILLRGISGRNLFQAKPSNRGVLKVTEFYFLLFFYVWRSYLAAETTIGEAEL